MTEWHIGRTLVAFVCQLAAESSVSERDGIGTDSTVYTDNTVNTDYKIDTDNTVLHD